MMGDEAYLMSLTQPYRSQLQKLSDSLRKQRALVVIFISVRFPDINSGNIKFFNQNFMCKSHSLGRKKDYHSLGNVKRISK